MKVKFPDGENILEHLEVAFSVINEMEKAFSRGEEVFLDFSEVHWFLPCSIILISNKIKELEDKRVKINYIPPSHPKANSHIKKLGFPLGTDEKGESYFPIKHIRNEPSDPEQLNNKLNELLEDLENRIFKKFGSNTVSYILGELVSNIDEHSRYKFASLTAQYYPNKNILDIAIFDNGISIPKLFEENDFSFGVDAESLQEAISGKSTKKEDNRGYGLNSCMKLSTEGLKGKLVAVSRKGVVVLEQGEEPAYYDLENNSLDGTFLYFRIREPGNKFNFYKYVE